jgi:MYXO-CTERM domain-containing protein
MTTCLRTLALMSTWLTLAGAAAAADASPAPLVNASTPPAATSTVSASPDAADSTSHKALALLAAGVGTVLFVSRRRHDD